MAWTEKALIFKKQWENRRRRLKKKKPEQQNSCCQWVDAAWFDKFKRPVHRLSNCHFPVDHDTLEHWFSAKKGKRPPKLVENLEGILIFLSNCAMVLKLKWRECMDRFDAYIRWRIYLQVLACNVLVHYEVSSGQCIDYVQVHALWNL